MLQRPWVIMNVFLASAGEMQIITGHIVVGSISERKAGTEPFINGDSFIPAAKTLEPSFKAAVFSTMEV